MTRTVPEAGPSQGFFAKSGLEMIRVLTVLGLLVVLGIYAQPRLVDIWIGLPFVVAGGWLRAWSAGYLLKTLELSITGPYAFTRNPLYLGRLLLLTGFGLMARLPGYGNLIILAVGYAIFFIYYLPRKERVECARLLETHGEPYRLYEAAVPALFPRLTPYRGAGGGAAGWHWRRFSRNREYLMLLMEAGLAGLFLARALGHLQVPWS
jgi:protein-S-isoprenylcysteine O-methyltransferase Ste14